MTDVTLHLTEMTVSSEDRLSKLFARALQDAIANKGQMDDEIYRVEGFCGRKFRLLLNNLVREMSGDARYLEVGIFKGATFCPVICGNSVKATGIDNWSWDKDNSCAPTFYNNLAKFKNNKSIVTIIEDQFRNVAAGLLGRFNIFFYDGSHEEKDQYDGIAWAMNALENFSIVLVDDWNWLKVRRGTMNALRDANVIIHYMVELRTRNVSTIMRRPV
jgi:hypothetical protein